MRDVKTSADKGSFQQAWAQSRAVLASTPSADDLSTLRTLFRKYPRIQESGVTATSRLIDAARTEEDLLRAQAEVGVLAKCVTLSLCGPAALAQLQTRFLAAASTLVLETGIPVTFESNLLAEWAASTGSDLDQDLERRVYQNTLAHIAARDPRNTPPILMTERLFRYLLREPEARKEAFDTLRKVEWRVGDLEGPMREVYPELVEELRKDLGFVPGIAFDSKGVEFGPWVRRFVARVRRNWSIPSAAMSLSGRTVVSFNVHKDGSISDIVLTVSSAIDAFNTSSFQAVAASSPTEPLPPEYPAEKAFFTVTFFYKGVPPQQ